MWRQQIGEREAGPPGPAPGAAEESDAGAGESDLMRLL